MLYRAAEVCMPEALETDSLIGTIIGALARVRDDATEATAILHDRAANPLPYLTDVLRCIHSLRLALDLTETTLVFLDAEVAA
jgi:hypothetical protein